MVETLFVMFGSVLVNVSKLRGMKAVPGNSAHTMFFFDGPSDQHNPMVVDCTMEEVQHNLSHTYSQMAMMQEMASRRSDPGQA